MEINNFKNIHFVGIKGVGMCALALCAQDLGIKITGSDTSELFVTDKILKERKIKWEVGFDENHISNDIDLVITTGAHGGLNNPEVLAAKEKVIPVLTHAEALAKFSEGKEVIAVCGVGGKTTTSAIIAHTLDNCGLNPSYAIGVGKIDPLGYPGKYVKNGKYFVCEADEFVNSPGIDNTPKFLFLNPKIVVVTNIEHDHPDVYPTLEDTKNAYFKFFQKIPSNGLLIINSNDKNAKEVSKNLSCKVVGFNTNEKIETSLPGEYNQKNLAAAIAVTDFLNISKEKVLQSIKSFKGTQRRFEKVGNTKEGAIIIDDYAHHPNEIKSVLKAARESYPERRIIAVFQPHTYSRTKALFEDFAKSFNDADVACFMDIYASAREKKDESVSSGKLAEETKKYNPNSFYIGNHERAIKWLKENLKNKDLLLTLGAGDIFYLHKELI
jgi:UDP-N-acetylmuramate--alanine ligase